MKSYTHSNPCDLKHRGEDKAIQIIMSVYDLHTSISEDFPEEMTSEQGGYLTDKSSELGEGRVDNRRAGLTGPLLISLSKLKS